MALQGSKNAMSLAQMSVKLMFNCVHQNSDTVGMIMAQLSMKASTKGLGAMTHEVDLYKPRSWHELTGKQNEQVLKSHIFVEQKSNDSTKEDVSSPTEHKDSTKEDVSSPTEPAEAVMLTCVIDVQEERYLAVANIPNAFSQNVVSGDNAEH